MVSKLKSDKKSKIRQEFRVLGLFLKGNREETREIEGNRGEIEQKQGK